MTSLAGLISAEFRDLVMISHEVDPLLLVQHVPPGTSLDFHDGRAFVSAVAFRMLNLAIAGVPVPFHQELAQVNFRFYVWRRVNSDIRRGVVFLREFVPSAAVTLGARLFFNENYITLPMRHEVVDAEQGWATYEWQGPTRWNRISSVRRGAPGPATPGSLEEFIKDRPWGYARQRDGTTLEYHVAHPAWDVWPSADSVVDLDVESAYGRGFETALSRAPASAFIAVGSRAAVSRGERIE